MTDARTANKRVVLLGLFLAFVLTECVIYMEKGLGNDIFAYFLMITHPVALFTIYEDIKVEIPDNRFLAAEKKAFSNLLSGLFEGILGALSIGLVFLPIALFFVYVFDFFGMTVGNSLIGNLIIIAFAILVPTFFLLGYFAVARGAFIAMALRSPSKVANNYVEMPKHQVCPKCGCVFSSPVYVCTCGERYPDHKGNPELVPSSQGTDFIECTNPSCRRMLPVTDQGGRDKLYKVCPDCSAPVAMFPGPSFLVTMAGPSGSGKTTLALRALHSLEANSVSRYPNPFGFPVQTPEAPIPPYVLCFGSKSEDERCLAIYDVNGRFFEGSRANYGQQPQYGQEDAILFVIDAVAKDGPERADMAANDFWQKYHLASQTSLTERIRTPIHVVVTHKDAIGDRADVRDFLISNGYKMLVSSIESNFSTVSYHMCDATKGSEAARVFSLVFEGIDKEVADILKRA